MAMPACDKRVTTIRRFVPKGLNGVQIFGPFWLFIYRKNKNSFLMVSGSCLCEPSLVPAFIVALSKRGVVEVTWKRAPAPSTAPVAKIHDHQCDRQDL